MFRPIFLRTLARELSFLALTTVAGIDRSAAATHLPVPCATGACANGPSTLVTSGKATAAQSANTLTVNQTTNSATLNWASFNVSADGKVVFKQPNSSSIALNRIFDAGPSSIFGNVTANGQIYLLNPNGLIFGSSSVVNVGSLLASSLNMTDATFQSGILASTLLKNHQGVLQPYTDSQGNVIANTGTITIQSGAQLSAADGGRLLLAASTVQNSGSLSAPDGQVILAAGQTVYLTASHDPNLRGLVVEVDGGGTASNQLGGALSAAHGNVSLVGLAVNQDGRISATTSVSANGSVRLEAGDTATIGGSEPNYTLGSTHGGVVTIGPDSQIDVLPDLKDTATADVSTIQQQSQINILGEQVIMQGGQIKAPDAHLTVTASANPSSGVVTDGNSDARIRIDSGTVIDLSGSNTVLPIDANLLTLQLRSNELADDPNQRNGALRNQTVTIDTRVGTHIVGSSALQGAENAVQQSVAQRTTGGGTAIFESEGDVVAAKGSTINVSGGAVSYTGGQLQTTQLVGANGRLYDIGSADPTLMYTGVVNPTFTQTYNQWGVQQVVPSGASHYEAGYVQGSSAGTVQFAAHNILLGGSLVGNATNGALQRNSNVAAGGTLIIGLPGGLAGSATTLIDFLSPSVTLTKDITNIVVSDDAALPGSLSLDLSPAYITIGGFTNTQVYSNISFTLPEGQALNLRPGNSLLVEAPRVAIFSDITVLGGSVNLQSLQTISSPDPSVQRAGITVGDGVTIDVSGQWTNDWLTSQAAIPTGQTYQNGGSIELKLDGSLTGTVIDPELLSIGNNVTLHASGGAWVQSNGSVLGGTGGAITLDAGSLESGISIGSHLNIDAFGVNGVRGGSFALTAPSIDIAKGTSDWTQAQRVDTYASGTGTSNGSVPTSSTAATTDTHSSFLIYEPLFSQYGFSSVSLIAAGTVASSASGSDILTVNSGTDIVAQTRSRTLDTNYSLHASGGTVAAFSQDVLLPDYLRPATSVALSVSPSPFTQVNPGDDIFGTLDIQKNSLIQVDPASSITLSGAGSILVDGTLRAPGGVVTLQIPGNSNKYVYGDPGYLPNQRIELGVDSIIDVSGVERLTPNDSGLLLGSILAGGSVSLDADRGYVAALAGSQINISGVSGLLDEQSHTGYSRNTVGSAGGSLSVRSPESVSLLGTLTAKAGISDIGQSAAGSLSVELSRLDPAWFYSIVTTNPYPSLSPLTIRLISDTSNNAVSAPNSYLAQLGVSNLMASGIDSLNLKADGLIEFATNLPLSLARSLRLDAPEFRVVNGDHASLAAPIIALGNSLAPCSGCTTTTGSEPLGTLSMSGQSIELFGASTVEDTRNVTLTSSGDVQLRYASVNSVAYGGLTVGANLTIDAERVYPNTDTHFFLKSDGLVGSGDTISFGSTGASPGTPISVGGTLAVMADRIVNGGTLIAPYGVISLEATTSVSLLDGSTLSVSGNGLRLPYGTTQYGGVQWLDPVTLQPISGIPQRAVNISAPNVKTAKGSTIDLSGGGDLYAYEFVSGANGTTDNLGSGAAAQYSGLYAILPSTLGQYAPYDATYYSGSSLTTGDSVYISGVAGLAAGIYPLLPARYALLPGAFIVKVEPGYSNLSPSYSSSLADGTPVVAGYFTVGNTGLRDPGYSGFAIYSGAYARTISGYQDSYASTFFKPTNSTSTIPVDLPADAGRLSLAVSNSAAGTSLDVEGSVLSSAASGGRAAPIDVSATNLVITGDTRTALPAGSVGLSADVAQSWQAGSLVLGGHLSADGTSIQVASDSVTIGSGASLTADQLMIVAGTSIDVQSGAHLASTSGAGGGRAPSTLPTATPISLSGPSSAGAALLAVSDESLPIAVRSSGGGSASTGGATLTVEAGSVLSSQGALSLDAPGTVDISGTINGKGASWSLASNSIAFVGKGASTDTLQINASLLGNLQQAGAVRLASAGSIDVLSPVSLGATSSAGAPTLSSLTLIGSSLNNTAGDSVFGAKTLTLQGLADGTPNAASATGGSGNLTLVAGELDIGPGTLTVNGFANTQAQVSGAVVGMGTGGLQLGGNLGISAAEITAANGATTNISASSGTLNIAPAAANKTPATLPSYLGGDLTLSANTINDSGSIVVAAGHIDLQAAQGINVTGAAVVDAGGTLVHAGTQTVGAAGGNVTLSAGADLTLASTATLNVSGATGAPAGNLSLVSGGIATVDAKLAGAAATGETGGSFSLDAGQLATSFTALSSKLLAGGFTQAIDVRARAGDLSLAAGGKTLANSVTLTADTGLVDVAGNISTFMGGQSGAINLFGGSGVTLESGGQLHADTFGSSGRGGTIELGTTSLGASATNAGTAGVITLNSGSVITALGATSAQNGELLLRAPALTATNDVSIGPIGSDVSRVGRVVIEPVELFFGDANNAVDFGAVQTQVGNYMNAATPTINARLNPLGSANVAIQAGVEIRQTGDFTLNQALDFYQNPWTANGAPIDLTIRATGNVNINASVSDGFQTVTGSRGTQLTQLTGETSSASLRFVAGADLQSANPLAINEAASADFVLAANTVVRTGTGEIDVVAARDVILSGAGSQIYTAGVQAEPTIAVGNTGRTFSFAGGGGNLVVRAGRDVIGTPVAQSASLWQLRQGNANNPAQWGVDLSRFQWNFGTLGGGDLSISAGRDIVNVSAAAADSLYAGGAGCGSACTPIFTAGGGVRVNSGRDVISSQFYVTDGVSALTAGRSFLQAFLNMGDAQVDIEARQDISIEGVVNPTDLTQGSLGNGASARQLAGGYFTYGENSSLNIRSTAGTITIENSQTGQFLGDSVGAANNGYDIYPASFSMSALTQDINFSPSVGVTLFPSDRGELALFAARDIMGVGGLAQLAMSDTPANAVPTAQNPSAGAGGAGPIPISLGGTGSGRHAGDDIPVLVTAGRDIVDLNLDAPKPAQIVATRDITNLNFTGQNLASTDETLISAGRDFVEVIGDAGNGNQVQLGGPGRLDLLAGRNVDIGFSFGLTTVGENLNPNLGNSQGADLTVLAGLGQSPDYTSFYSKIILPSMTYQQDLVSYVESQTGQTGLSVAGAESEFSAFTSDAQRPLVDQIFFTELVASGREANTVPKAGYSRGYAAIDALFPNSRTVAGSTAQSPYLGDLKLEFSRIYTLSGGTISLLAPGGAVDVGLASPPAGVSPKDPAQLGIVAEGTGNVDIYSTGDVLVNASRIFTLGGGNIAIWSDEGSIDAGRGAKSSVSAPPPIILVDSSGKVTVSITGAVAGSGIRTIQTEPGQAAGNVDLIAPVGTVNAGDAGIGAAGNINIAAQSVIGVDNINFGGTATGVPAQISSLGASLSAVSNASSGATSAATNAVAGTGAESKEATPLAQAAIGWLDVFVTGLGEDACKPDDMECLKRQKR
jgi:filamentous hemagglutinin